MLKFGSMPRNSPSGGSRSSQGRFRIAGMSEDMTRVRLEPGVAAALTLSHRSRQPQVEELASQSFLIAGSHLRGAVIFKKRSIPA